MKVDVERVLGLVRRDLAWVEKDGQKLVKLIASRVYDTHVDDAWDALTNRERIPRWFMPIDGDLKLGGRYQLAGNAGGTITACEPPKHLAMTWEYGGMTTWVEVTLQSVASEKTRLTLEHTAPVDDKWNEYGPGATGVGWEGGLLGLDLYLANGGKEGVAKEGMKWAMSDEGKRFNRVASELWCKADIAFGTDPAKARSAADKTRAAYTGE
jgi:uncharacterized protein YndB with AHSA1/START domain